MLCLEGITKEELNNCLAYMYNGEVQIFQEDLDRFLNVAQRFKIKGLLNDGEIEDKEEYEEESTNVEGNNIKNSDQQLAKFQNSVHEVRKVSSQRETKILSPNEGYDMKRDTEQYIERIDNDTVQCKVCGKTSSGRAHFGVKVSDMRRHIETHIEGLSYPCPSCDKICRSQNSLKHHKQKVHKDLN